MQTELQLIDQDLAKNTNERWAEEVKGIIQK
jgi:hypothetical protein